MAIWTSGEPVSLAPRRNSPISPVFRSFVIVICYRDRSTSVGSGCFYGKRSSHRVCYNSAYKMCYEPTTKPFSLANRPGDCNWGKGAGRAETSPHFSATVADISLFAAKMGQILGRQEMAWPTQRNLVDRLTLTRHYMVYLIVHRLLGRILKTMASATVKVDAETYAKLRETAAQTGQPMIAVLARAVDPTGVQDLPGSPENSDFAAFRAIPRGGRKSLPSGPSWDQCPGRRP